MALPITCTSIGGATFLGCSVIDFNASAGWGSQSSEVTINLVEDCTTSPPQAFEVPTVGMPVHFEMDNFNFTGLVQAWDAKAGSDGYPLFSVKLISPHPILEHAQVILDHYEGSVPLFNIINAYGFLESLGTTCSNPNIGGTFFGAPAGGFGGANRTERGIPWFLIKQAVQILAGGATGAQYNTFCSGLAFRGKDNSTIQYILDLSSIPNANANYRIAGPVVSLMDLIDQVCQDGGMDYYVTLVPSGLAGKGDLYIIKVVTISRKEEPAIGVQGTQTLGDIYDFVNSNHVVNKSLGVELRSEVNSGMVIGGKVKQYYQCTNPAGMTHFWGYNAEGGLITAAHTGGLLGWRVNLDCRKINLSLHKTLSIFTVVGENELRASLGDFNSFCFNITNETNSASPLHYYYKYVLKVGPADVRPRILNAAHAAGDAKFAIDTSLDDGGAMASENLRDAKAVYNWLKSYTSDFYGKQFLVYFSLDSVVCQSQDTYTQQETYTDMVSSDGAWPSVGTTLFDGEGFSEASDILGIPNPSESADRFKDDSGKVQAMIKFTGASTFLNTDGLSLDDYIVIDQGGGGGFALWIKATVEDAWVKGSPVTNIPLRCALVKLSAPVIDSQNDITSTLANRPIDVMVANGALTPNPIIEGGAAANMLGGQGESVSSFGPPVMTFPAAIGVPMQSTTTCYGPWQSVGTNPGSVQVEIDDGLVPWEYGGLSYMHLAGNAKVQEMATHQQQAERGEITVPGLPQKSLATNINLSDAGGVSNSVVNVGETALNFYVYNYNSAQQSSAVISNISTSIGAGGITTTYTINSFTPVFGRFSKGNAERLKQIGLNRLKGEREIRSRSALRNLIRGSEMRSRFLANTVVEDMGHPIASMSPAIWFAGKIDSDNTKRKLVIAPDKKTMPFYSETEAAKTSVMTMDGFFRPVQTQGGNASNLPKVVNNYVSCGTSASYQSSGPPPPVTGQEPLKISAKYLDFLADKEKRTGLFDDERTAGSTDGLGHDIEGVARGTTANDLWDGNSPGRLIMHTGAGDDEAHDFFDNYRFLALRGPLMVHGWGYDLNGKPIPNKVRDLDPPVGQPTFGTSYAGLKDEFYPDWLENANTWPVAPVDLRFDRKRGVWTIPSAFRLYQVTVSGSEGNPSGIPAGSSGPANVIKYKDDILNSDGTSVENPRVMLSNWTDTFITSGTKALAYYDTAECEYWVVAGGGGGDKTSGVTTGIDVVTKVCCSGANFAITRHQLGFESGVLISVTGEPRDMECSG